MNRFALNDLSHQKNLNSHTSMSHQKVFMSAQQSKNNPIINSSSFSFQNSQQAHQQQLPFPPQTQTSVKDTSFQPINQKSTENIGMFSQQYDKENKISQSLLQIEPPQQKFGSSYQIFEHQFNLAVLCYQSMIEEGIKEIQQIFQKNDHANRKQQRVEAFSSMLNISQLENSITNGFDKQLPLDNSSLAKNCLSIPEAYSNYDQNSAIEKSLSMLNEEYAISDNNFHCNHLDQELLMFSDSDSPLYYDSPAQQHEI